MSLHIVHSFLKSICETLDNIRIFINIALLCAESGVGNIAAVLAQGGYHIAFSLGFKSCGARFELNREIPLAL